MSQTCFAVLRFNTT